MSEQTQLDRIESKINDLVKTQSKNTTDIKWIKSAGGLIVTAFLYLANKLFGEP